MEKIRNGTRKAQKSVQAEDSEEVSRKAAEAEVDHQNESALFLRHDGVANDRTVQSAAVAARPPGCPKECRSGGLIR